MKLKEREDVRTKAKPYVTEGRNGRRVDPSRSEQVGGFKADLFLRGLHVLRACMLDVHVVKHTLEKKRLP